MRIKQVDVYSIEFDNGNEITYNHIQDCCENNYADFIQIDESLVEYDYDFNENLEFEKVGDSGFRFGSDEHWIFVPCYSEQDGWYSTDVDIYYNDKLVLSTECEVL